MVTDTWFWVSAGVNANSPMFGQLATEEKTTEITAIPDMIDLKGDTATVDVMGCQTGICGRFTFYPSTDEGEFA